MVFAWVRHECTTIVRYGLISYYGDSLHQKAEIVCTIIVK